LIRHKLSQKLLQSRKAEIDHSTSYPVTCLLLLWAEHFHFSTGVLHVAAHPNGPFCFDSWCYKGTVLAVFLDMFESIKKF
jgi:hypothetical protein